MGAVSGHVHKCYTPRNMHMIWLSLRIRQAQENTSKRETWAYFLGCTFKKHAEKLSQNLHNIASKSYVNTHCLDVILKVQNSAFTKGVVCLTDMAIINNWTIFLSFYRHHQFHHLSLNQLVFSPEGLVSDVDIPNLESISIYRFSISRTRPYNVDERSYLAKQH